MIVTKKILSLQTVDLHGDSLVIIAITVEVHSLDKSTEKAIHVNIIILIIITTHNIVTSS